MSRLYEIAYDEKTWNIQGSRDGGYTIVRKETFESYFLGGDIIGIEQITDDTFLVFHRTMRNQWTITRLRLANGKKIREYEHDYHHSFYFLNDTTIIFDPGSKSSTTVYSIDKNYEISNVDHLISGSSEKSDHSYYLSRNIELIYDKNISEYPIYLSIVYELHSFRCKEFIQLLVNPNTWIPFSPAYSTLRNQFISINDDLSLEDVFSEHNTHLRVIDDFLYNKYYNTATKSASELWSIVNNKQDEK